jgi:membrane protease YdiL (CAAX protease family)
VKRFTGVTGGGVGVGLTPTWLRTRLAVEFFALFIVVPVLVYQWINDIVARGDRPTGVVIITIAGAVSLSLIVLLTDRSFDRRQLWHWAGWRLIGPAVLLNFVVLMTALTVVFVIFDPGKLFGLMLEKPWVWAAIMVFYPLWSVYPQELVYRAFIFHRYRPLFTTEPAMVWASALAFGWAHIILHNWVAVALTIWGGYLFARTYARSGSLAAAWIEHCLYGCGAFTVGMGAYFYAGAIGMR